MMEQGYARELWNVCCRPSLGVADGEEVPGATPLFGAAAVVSIPCHLFYMGDKEGEKKVADFLRKWANAIEGKGFRTDKELWEIRMRRVREVIEENKGCFTEITVNYIEDVIFGELDEELLTEAEKETCSP